MHSCHSVTLRAWFVLLPLTQPVGLPAYVAACQSVSFSRDGGASLTTIRARYEIGISNGPRVFVPEGALSGYDCGRHSF